MSQTDPKPATPQPAPAAQLMKLIEGRLIGNMLATAVEMKIADQLKDGPKSAHDVATAAGTNPDATYRLMRALSNAGVFEEHEGQRFSLTPVGERLRTDVRGSLAGLARFYGASWHVAAWQELHHAVKTGKNAFEKAHGQPAFEWFKTHPDEYSVFSEAMTANSTVNARAVVAAYDFSGCERIADIGGGQGFLLGEILAANPKAHGVVFDMPDVVAGATRLIADRGLSQRCEAVGGDFFQSVPLGCDTYIVKHVIHDWDDEASVALLGNIARAMAAGGRVLVAEQIMPGPGVSHFVKLLDIEMLVVSPGGRERTAAEYSALFDKAGLVLSRVVPTKSLISVLEARKR